MTQLQLLATIVGFAFICGILGSVLCGSRAQTIGFFLGLFLGPFGVIAAAIRGNRHAAGPSPGYNFSGPPDDRALNLLGRLEPIIEITREIRFHDEGVPAWIMASRSDVLRLQEALRTFDQS